MAFRDGEESFDPRLKEVGQDIVKKCAGGPLAIRTIGSLLYNKKENEWLYFKEHELSRIDKLDHGIMEILKLSYDHLPSWLKHCFAYFALFPKDYIFDKQTMILLWMAQGFIESLDGNEDLEETGDRYVSELLDRSFLEVEEADDSTGEVKMFKMHDLMHDLALKVTGDECKLVNLNEGGIRGGIRHASFASKSWSLQEVVSLLEATSLLDAANLRTFLCLKKMRTYVGYLSPNEHIVIFSKLRHCRTLVLDHANYCIPPSLGSRLKHLRFLDISENQSIESLPDSITDLVNLQTLKLSGCKKLTTLPRELRKLVNLRYLDISENKSIKSLSDSITNLVNLQTLKLSGCKKLTTLPRDLRKLVNLRFLDVSGNQSIESLPNSIVDLPNLQTLKLSSCQKLTTLPRDLRKLVNLRHLLIDGCDSLSNMPCGLNHLTSLQTLSQFILQKMDHKVPSCVGRVDELGGSNRLAGSITLQKLEFLQPAPNKGHLREKQRLRSLELNWSMEQQDDKSESDELIIWENLRPHPNLAHLTLQSCMLRSPPSWLSSIRYLVKLKLFQCGGWKYLPPLSQLSSLRELTLWSLNALEFVQEMSDSKQSNIARPFFPSLERLLIFYCHNQKGWWGRRQLVGAYQDHWQYDSQSSFPKLSTVHIELCQDLNSVPLFPWIEFLSLHGVSANLLEHQVITIPNCQSEAIGVSAFIPFSKLKRLHFVDGSDLKHSMLETLPQSASNLESMSLYHSRELRNLSRGMQYLSSLEYLSIGACEELNLSSHDDKHGAQWRSLTKLRGLSIEKLPKLVELPEGIQYVTSLQFLTVVRCENLMSLPGWIGYFSSLQELKIIGCPGLTCLPDGMRHLTSLKCLTTDGCPALEERCQRESGADWEKIAHVYNEGKDWLFGVRSP